MSRQSNHFFRGTWMLLALSWIAACSPQDQAAVRADIEARNQEIGAAIARGDGVAVAALYTAGAQLLPPHAQAVSGREGITRLWQGFVESGVKGLVLTTAETEGHGDTADEAGTYKVLGPDAQVLDTGKYIVIWKRENGAWFLHRDIWNSDLPPPPSAAIAPLPPPVH